MNKEDRTRCTRAAVLPPVFRRLMDELQLYDAWREHHGDMRDYTFFLQDIVLTPRSI